MKKTGQCLGLGSPPVIQRDNSTPAENTPTYTLCEWATLIHDVSQTVTPQYCSARGTVPPLASLSQSINPLYLRYYLIATCQFIRLLYVLFLKLLTIQLNSNENGLSIESHNLTQVTWGEASLEWNLLFPEPKYGQWLCQSPDGFTIALLQVAILHNLSHKNRSPDTLTSETICSLQMIGEEGKLKEGKKVTKTHTNTVMTSKLINKMPPWG